MIVLFLAYFGEGENGNQFGGAEKVFANLANWISRNTGHHVIFASVGMDVLPYPLAAGIEYKHYDADLSSKVKTHISLIRNVRRVMKDFSPDRIISFSVHPLFYMLFSLKARKTPIFFSIRNDPKLENSKITRFMRFFVMNRAKGIVFQTKEAQDYFQKRIREKSVVIHNPVSVDISKYPLKETMDNRIVFVGRLNPQKNIGLLIQAFETIHEEYPELTLEIYGEGNLHRKLQDQIDGLGLTAYVKLMGAYSDVISRIYGARMFVLPSLYEGMPNSLMEAMALGIPVVSSDCPCGGPRELIQNGVNGFLFENGSLDSIVDKMKRCLNFQDISSLCNKEKEIGIDHSEKRIFAEWINFVVE